MNDSQFLDLIDEIRIKDFSLNSTKSVVRKINKLLLKMGVADIDEEALENKIEELPESAREALLQALKDEDIAAVLSIVGMKPSMKKGIV